MYILYCILKKRKQKMSSYWEGKSETKKNENGKDTLKR